MTYEQSIMRIEEIIAKLSDESVTLDSSLDLFQEGTRLLNECNILLDKVEKKAEVFLPEGKYEQQL